MLDYLLSYQAPLRPSFTYWFDVLGLIRSEGEVWKEHRRFAISTLRDLGMGKNWFENAILGEINELIREFASYAGEAHPSTHTMLAVSNVISAIIFGRRYEHSDGQFQKMISLFGENIRLLVAMAPLDYFPILQNIPFGRLHRAREEFRVKYNTVKTFVRSMIIARQTGTSRDKSTEVGDYITRFHDKERKRTLANSLSTFTGTLLDTLVKSVIHVSLKSYKSFNGTNEWTSRLLSRKPICLKRLVLGPGSWRK